jgi:hypothetical protein
MAGVDDDAWLLEFDPYSGTVLEDTKARCAGRNKAAVVDAVAADPGTDCWPDVCTLVDSVIIATQNHGIRNAEAMTYVIMLLASFSSASALRLPVHAACLLLRIRPRSCCCLPGWLSAPRLHACALYVALCMPCRTASGASSVRRSLSAAPRPHACSSRRTHLPRTHAVLCVCVCTTCVVSWTLHRLDAKGRKLYIPSPGVGDASLDGIVGEKLPKAGEKVDLGGPRSTEARGWQ